jgi:hypothetical protein
MAQSVSRESSKPHPSGGSHEKEFPGGTRTEFAGEWLFLWRYTSYQVPTILKNPRVEDGLNVIITRRIGSESFGIYGLKRALLKG